MKQRQTSVELLRVIAMLMVMTLHVNFTAIGVPTSESILTCEGIARTLLQMLCICAVNTFVMISGWFGIRPSIKGFLNFIWQVFYFVGLAYLIGYFWCDQPIGIRQFISCFGLLYGGGWFVASYIGLYILSPILNAYLATASSRNIIMLLVGFFAFEFIWGNSLSVAFIVGGYSTISFIGIYLLSGLLRKLSLKIKANIVLLLFLGCVIINSVLYVITKRLGLVAITPMVSNYINPFTICCASLLVLYFTNIQNSKNVRLCKIINWLGASSFGAYLLHVGTSVTFQLYTSTARSLYESYSGFEAVVMISLFVLGVFFLAIMLDQPRKWIWNNLFNPLISKYYHQ